MSETEAFRGNIEWLGWDKPAIELVAKRLLKLRKERPESFRRAVLVLPTAESARRLREYMAVKVQQEAKSATAPLLMPRVMQLGHLLHTEGNDIATEQETLAAWLRVLCKEGEDPVASYAPLISRRPEKHLARWAVGTALKLMQLRQQLEQEGVSCDAVTHLLERKQDGAAEEPSERVRAARRKALGQENLRWRKLGELFARVDAQLAKTTPQQARAELVQHPHWPGRSRLMILACVPELSPQLKCYLNNLHGTEGGEVHIWVNAPKAEAKNFDTFGMPTEAWCRCEVKVPDALVYQDEMHVDADRSTLHLVDDAEELAREAVRLTAGLRSDEVMVAVGDTAYTPAIIGAFETAAEDAEGKPKGWNLYAPEGRTLLTTEVGRLPEQLADLCAAREEFRLTAEDEGGMGELNAFSALICNGALQRVLKTPYSVAVGLQKHVEALRNQLLPATTAALCDILNPAVPLPSEGNLSLQILEKQRRAEYYEYVCNARRWADACCNMDTVAEQLTKLANRLINLYADSSLKKPVDKLARLMMQAAEDSFVHAVGDIFLLLETLRRQTEDAATGVQNTEERHISVGDVYGWREVPFAAEKRIILAALHDGCVPEPACGSEFLPASLCEELGIRSEASRTARDTFLFTALLAGRKAGQVHIIITRQNPDGSGAAPSSLLLRCGQELPQRARVLFAEASAKSTPVSVPSMPLFRADTQGRESIIPGEMESITEIALGKPNPFAEKTQDADGTESYKKTFSPSSLSLFLQCPLSFWMKHLFGLDAADIYEEDKCETAANDYGTLMHSILQKLVLRYPHWEALVTAAGTEDKTTLCDFLSGEALEICRAEWKRCYKSARFREAMPLPLMVQEQNMEQTLCAFAERHVSDLAEGWSNIACEYELTPTLTLSNGERVRFKMTADRIDRNKDNGHWRIIDYKTSSKEKKPFDVHLEKVKGGEDAPFYRFMNVAGYHFAPLLVEESAQKKKNEQDAPAEQEKITHCYRWSNVQLMLYAFGLKQTDPSMLKDGLPETSLSEVMPELFYYTLQGDTQQLACHDFLQEADKKLHQPAEQLLANAMKTVEAAIRMITDGVCLFSAESLGNEPPYSKLRDFNDRESAPRFGGISPLRDPRSLFCLPALQIPATPTVAPQD